MLLIMLTKLIELTPWQDLYERKKVSVHTFVGFADVRCADIVQRLNSRFR